MKKAQLVETVERDGKTIRIYDNGMEYDMSSKKIAKPPTNAKITTERAKELRQLRADKHARLLREAIVTETMDKLQMPKHGPVAAIAAAGGILWREIVLNDQAYPRDRLEAWKELGTQAQVIPNLKQTPAQEKNETATDILQAAAELLREMRQTIQPREVIDGTVTDATDTRNE